MSTERLSASVSVSELLGKQHFVIEDTFICRKNGVTDETARQNVLARLSQEGITVNSPIGITFCDSEENRTIEIIKALGLKKSLGENNIPQMYIVSTTEGDAHGLFEKISNLITTKNLIMDGVSGEHITILQLNASVRSKITDMRTGLSLVALKRGEPAYPMHPTPAH